VTPAGDGHDASPHLIENGVLWALLIYAMDAALNEDIVAGRARLERVRQAIMRHRVGVDVTQREDPRVRQVLVMAERMLDESEVAGAGQARSQGNER
jgi:hypothetical protein